MPGRNDSDRTASNVCVEQAQRGSVTWTAATASCTDAEWYSGCVMGAAMMNTTDDWEWVADKTTNNNAKKRGGGGACEDMSSHEIFIDPYGYRCCVAKQ